MFCNRISKQLFQKNRNTLEFIFFFAKQMWKKICFCCDLLCRHLREFLLGSSLCYLSWQRHITVPTWVWSHICSALSRGRRRQTRTKVKNLLFIKSVVITESIACLRNLKAPICLCIAESNNHPPQLPPRNFTADGKECESKTSEQASKSLSETYLMRLQHMDLSMYGHISNELHCRL